MQVGSAGGPARSITHAIEEVAAAEKTEWLAKFLRRTDGPVLVFVRTKSGAERLARKLAAGGLKAAALHADRTQAERTQAVEGFRSGRYRVLVATDVAARGLDIDGITHVVNYEVPSNRETYVHRVGRTGRAEATGTALTLVAPEELRALQALQRSVGLELAELMDDFKYTPSPMPHRHRLRSLEPPARRPRPQAVPEPPAPTGRRSRPPIPRSRNSGPAAGGRRPTRATSAPTATSCRSPARKASSRNRGARSARSTSCAARRRSASGSTTVLTAVHGHG